MAVRARRHRVAGLVLVSEKDGRCSAWVCEGTLRCLPSPASMLPLDDDRPNDRRRRMIVGECVTVERTLSKRSRILLSRASRAATCSSLMTCTGFRVVNIALT